MSKFTNVNAEPTNEAKTKFARFGLDDVQIAVLRDNGLKPEEIAGDHRTQAERVGELVRWFVRLADQAANPKRAVRHAYELAYYVATTDDRGAVDISAIRREAYREGILATSKDRRFAAFTGFIPAPHPDDAAVDRFAEAMKEKLAKKRDEGRGGWEDKSQCSNEFLSELLREHVEKGDPVDVGNLAMMIHQRDERIARKAAQAPAPVEVLVESLAEYLCAEFDFELDPVVGAAWPEHENDDGYRGNGAYARLQPSDVQARARENASRIIAFFDHSALAQLRAPAPHAVQASELAALRAENERLREALRPFADFISGTNPVWADERRISTLNYDFDKLRIGIFRRAAAALDSLSGLEAKG